MRARSVDRGGFTLVETLIAASIVYMALENIVGARLHRRWLVAFAFGLVHGFGFSFVLRESLQFAGENSHTNAFARSPGRGMIGFGTLRTHSSRS